MYRKITSEVGGERAVPRSTGLDSNKRAVKPTQPERGMNAVQTPTPDEEMVGLFKEIRKLNRREKNG